MRVCVELCEGTLCCERDLGCLKSPRDVVFVLKLKSTRVSVEYVTGTFQDKLGTTKAWRLAGTILF